MSDPPAPDSQLPEPGGSRAINKPKRRSLLPPPKAYNKKAAPDTSTASSKPPTALPTAVPSTAHPPSSAVPSSSTPPSSAVPSCSNTPSSAVPSSSTPPSSAVPLSGNTPSSAAPLSSNTPSSAVPLSSTPPQSPEVGDKVTIAGVKQGTVKFVGALHFAEGEWYGIELDDGDGKNDGTAEGVRYFSCPPQHGIFAPLSKLEVIRRDRTPTSPLDKTRSPSPDKTSRLPQLKSRARSNSPEHSTAKIAKTELSETDVKPKSRLTRPKLLPPRHLRDEIGSTGSSAPSSRESSASPSRDDSDAGSRDQGDSLGHSKSKIKSFGGESKLPKKSGIPGLAGGKPLKRSLPKPVTKPKEETKPDLNETFTIDDDQAPDNTYSVEIDEDIPEVTSPSRVDTKTALTLAYDLETENSDLDKQKLNLTFEVKKEKSESAKQSPASNASNSINSPIPDLLSTSVYSSKGSPVDYPGDCMSESEDNVEFLAQADSPGSHGSLGILDEQDLCDNSLLGDDLKAALGVKDEKSSNHVNVKEVNKNWVDREFDEKDLDHEISGISTPEIDISSRSSTVSDKIVPSSPEPDSALKRSDEFHLSDSSSSASPSHARLKKTSESESVESEPPANSTFTVAASDATFCADRKPSLMSKSIAECSQESKEEKDSLPMTASFELTRTAVTQYASLLEAAEKGKAQLKPKTDKRSSYHEDMQKRDAHSRSSSQEKTLKRYSTGSDFSHIDFEHSKLRKLDLTDKSKKMNKQDADFEVEETEEEEEEEGEEQTSIIEELVSMKKERPTSTISSCSNDTGIVDDDDDLNLNKDGQQRPVSLISTTSTDTGILSDFVDHCNGNSKKPSSPDGTARDTTEGGKKNSDEEGGETRERPEYLYSVSGGEGAGVSGPNPPPTEEKPGGGGGSGADSDNDMCLGSDAGSRQSPYEDKKDREEEDDEEEEVEDTVRSWICSTEGQEDIAMVTTQQSQIPKSSTEEDIATPLEDDGVSRDEDIMPAPVHETIMASQAEDVMAAPPREDIMTQQIVIEPDNPSQQSFASLSSDSLDGPMDAADNLAAVSPDQCDKELVTPVVEQLEEKDNMIADDAHKFISQPLPNVSTILQSVCSTSKQKLPSPDLLMDSVHEKITRESVHEVQKGIPSEKSQISSNQGMSDLVEMCDNKTPTQDLHNYNELHSKYHGIQSLEQESSAHELTSKSELNLTSNPHNLTPNPHKLTSNPHGMKASELLTDPQGLPQVQHEIMTYPLGVIANPHPSGNPDNVSPAGKTPSPVEIHGLPKPMDNVDELNNPSPLGESSSPSLVNQISMDVEGNIGVEFVSHTETNGEEESMDVDQEDFELPVPNGEPESIMTMSVHSLTGRFIEVVSVPPQAEELPLPPSPEPLENLLADLEEEKDEKEEEKEETPRKKARQSTPSKKKRPESGRERTPVPDSKQKQGLKQRRSSAKEDDVKVGKSEVQRKKSLAKVQSRIGETFRRGVVKSPSKEQDDLNSSTSSSSSMVKRSGVSSLQRKPLASPKATSTPIPKPAGVKVDTPKLRPRSADQKPRKSSQDLGSGSQLNGSSDSVAEKKVLKRNPPKSKWSNITSQIDSSKTGKPKEVKSRVLPKTPPKQPTLKVTPASPRSTTTSPAVNGSKPNTPRRALIPKTSLQTAASTSSSPPSSSSSPTPAASKTGPSATSAASKRVTGRSLTTPNVSSLRRISAPAVTNGINGNLPARNTSLSSVRRGSGLSARASPSPDTGVTGRRGGPDVGGMANGVRAPRPSSASTTRAQKQSASDPPVPGSRPANRTTSTIKKQRSDSTGSESQASKSKPEVKGQDEVDGPVKRAPLKRRSLADIAAARQKSLAATRKTSLASGTTAPGIKSPRSTAVPTTSTTRKPPTNTGPRGKATKSTAPSSSSTSSPSMKRPHQPDLLPGGPNTGAEIGRLEALCEVRTKEVTEARRQIRHSEAGFQAMVTLVRYLTEQLDAFSCPEVKTKLKDTEEELNKSKQYLKELTVQRDALIDEIQCLKQQQRTDAERWQAESRKREAEIEERLLRERREEIEKVTESQRRAISSLKEKHAGELEELEAAHRETTKKLTDSNAQQQRQQQQQYDNNLKELHQKHEAQLQEITVRFGQIKSTLSDKLRSLHEECEEMKRREATFEAACRRDADLQVQMALNPYKHLPAEVDSLKAVLELRNEEIHKLRQNNAELRRELEALPVARERIARLEHKIENLEAIMDIKGDYEKQLAEKHQQLLRKFDRESKANKRLSMDNEELSWRLSIGETGLSPSQSEASTPEPHRRSLSRSSNLKSPLPVSTSSPRSPRSPRTVQGYDFDGVVMRSPRSPTVLAAAATRQLMSPQAGGERIREESPTPGKLKRSGTYDLLDQAGESDSNHGDDMRQSDV